MGERASHRLTHRGARPARAHQAFPAPRPRSAITSPIASCAASCSHGSRTSSKAIPPPRRALRKPLPRCSTAARCRRSPSAGQGGAGEILALYPLFAELSTRFDLEVKERGSLINGSPCAAALIADAAIAARRRLQLAIETFALSIEAFRAPLEHYDEALEALWGDRGRGGSPALVAQLPRRVGGRRNYQAPVSYRIVPRILGHAHRAVAAAERAARISLASISDNPVYLAAGCQHPFRPLHQHRRLPQRHGGPGTR